jgi:hypothetical protein
MVAAAQQRTQPAFLMILGTLWDAVGRCADALEDRTMTP